jgi:hypothetical protein
MSLSKQQIDVLRLIQRSKPDDDGWYRVRKVIWPLVYTTLSDDLIEADALDEGGGRVRFTQRGQAVADYL